jgi:hypothetical protein
VKTKKSNKKRLAAQKAVRDKLSIDAAQREGWTGKKTPKG